MKSKSLLKKLFFSHPKTIVLDSSESNRNLNSCTMKYDTQNCIQELFGGQTLPVEILAASI